MAKLADTSQKAGTSTEMLESPPPPAYHERRSSSPIPLPTSRLLETEEYEPLPPSAADSDVDKSSRKGTHPKDWGKRVPIWTVYSHSAMLWVLLIFWSWTWLPGGRWEEHGASGNGTAPEQGTPTNGTVDGKPKETKPELVELGFLHFVAMPVLGWLVYFFLPLIRAILSFAGDFLIVITLFIYHITGFFCRILTAIASGIYGGQEQETLEHFNKPLKPEHELLMKNGYLSNPGSEHPNIYAFVKVPEWPTDEYTRIKDGRPAKTDDDQGSDIQGSDQNVHQGGRFWYFRSGGQAGRDDEAHEQDGGGFWFIRFKKQKKDNLPL